RSACAKPVSKEVVAARESPDRSARGGDFQLATGGDINLAIDKKDALSGVIYDVTSEWDVPLMVTRGYASLSFLHAAARQIEETGKPTYLYYLGDYDPSGVDIPRKVERDLRRMVSHAEIVFTRLAVNPGQIEQMHLPTRPTKLTDSRSATFVGESVEVDAIPAPALRQMVYGAITSHVDPDRLRALIEVEQAERETLEAITLELRRPA
ncbi:MAG: hypothetical protein ACYDA2_09775, partial [Acidimicrobiales bacterium]